MTKVTLQYPSVSLGTTATVYILLPKERPSVFDNGGKEMRGGAFPVLYLLHGAFDSAECWIYNTDICRLTDSLGFACVLPSVQNSFYLDDECGAKYYTFVTEELPQYLSEILPLSQKRDESYIGGLSMGGYGAFLASLTRPEQYGRVFSMSGALDLSLAARFVAHCGGTLPAAIKNTRQISGGQYDLYTLLSEKNVSALPEYYIACGDSDYFFSSNKEFYEKLSETGAKCTFSASPGGHDWDYWGAQLKKCVRWMTGKEDTL